MIQHVRSAFSRLTDALGAEQERWPLWLPVFFGIGIGLYFVLLREPPGWVGLAALAVAVAGCIALRKRPHHLLAGIAVALVAGGFAVAQGRAALVDAPMLPRKTPPVLVEGRIAEIESKTTGYRVMLDHVRIEGQARAATPERVRIRVRDPDGILRPGGWIVVRAMLSPPPPPATPGGYDFQRQAYFQGVGAVGFAVAKRPQSTDPPAGRTAGWSPVVWLDGARAKVTHRIMEASGGGAAGAITAALLTGQQGAIPDDVLQAMRDSGLAHLLAISGQNISIIAGFVFLLVRGLLALIPPVALRYPIKKWAAAAGFASALFYLLLSGAGVPTQRSVAMIGLVLLAVILDRSVISMRPLAWAALFILVILPEAMMGPSFQLSFAAVAALVAAYEALPCGYGAWARGPDGSASWALRAGRHLLAVAITSLVAIVATTPFAAYHFNRFSLYGLVANMVAVPLTDLWIMPWALAVLALMPFGLEHWALGPMAAGVQVMIDVAREVASWPSAVIAMPVMPTTALVLITMGGLWLFIWRGRVRFLGLAPIAIGVMLSVLARAPDILVSGDARLVALRAPAGGLAVWSAGGGKFETERWLLQAGEEEALPWPARDATEDGGWLTCDPLGCLYRPPGHVVALVRQADALAEDCAVAELVVSLVPVRRACAGPPVIDRFDLWRNGTHAIWLEASSPRIETVRGRQGDRPWVPRQERAKKTAPRENAAPSDEE
ncbi:MAG: ComEC/Rec2 family competence protein [Alphaproteobacteria bacterium]